MKVAAAVVHVPAGTSPARGMAGHTQAQANRRKASAQTATGKSDEDVCPCVTGRRR